MKVKKIIITLLMVLLAVNVVIGEEEINFGGDSTVDDVQGNEDQYVDDYLKSEMDDPVDIDGPAEQLVNQIEVEDGDLTIGEGAEDVEFPNGLPEGTEIETGARVDVDGVQVSSDKGNIQTADGETLQNDDGGTLDLGELSDDDVQGVRYTDDGWVLERGDDDNVVIDGNRHIVEATQTGDEELEIVLEMGTTLDVADGMSVNYDVLDDGSVDLTVNGDDVPDINGLDGSHIEIGEGGSITVDNTGILSDTENLEGLDSIDLAHHDDDELSSVTYNHDDGAEHEVSNEEGLSGTNIVWTEHDEKGEGPITPLAEEGTTFKYIPDGDQPTSEMVMGEGWNAYVGMLGEEYAADTLNEGATFINYVDGDEAISFETTEQVTASAYHGMHSSTQRKKELAGETFDTEVGDLITVAEDNPDDDSMTHYFGHDMKYEEGNVISTTEMPGAESETTTGLDEDRNIYQEVTDADVEQEVEDDDETLTVSGNGEIEYDDNDEMERVEDMGDGTEVEAQGHTLRSREEGQSVGIGEDGCEEGDNCLSSSDSVELNEGFEGTFESGGITIRSDGEGNFMRRGEIPHPGASVTLEVGEEHEEDEFEVKIKEGGVDSLSDGTTSNSDEVDPSMDTHEVEEGDTLWDIAREHDVSVDELMAANDDIEGDIINPGQELDLPDPDQIESEDPDLGLGQTYEVQQDDTLSEIAADIPGYSAEELADYNDIDDIHHIGIGEDLDIPEAEVDPEDLGISEPELKKAQQEDDIEITTAGDESVGDGTEPEEETDWPPVYTRDLRDEAETQLEVEADPEEEEVRSNGESVEITSVDDDRIDPDADNEYEFTSDGEEIRVVEDERGTLSSLFGLRSSHSQDYYIKEDDEWVELPDSAYEYARENIADYHGDQRAALDGYRDSEERELLGEAGAIMDEHSKLREMEAQAQDVEHMSADTYQVEHEGDTFQVGEDGDSYARETDDGPETIPTYDEFYDDNHYRYDTDTEARRSYSRQYDIRPEELEEINEKVELHQEYEEQDDPRDELHEELD